MLTDWREWTTTSTPPIKDLPAATRLHHHHPLPLSHLPSTIPTSTIHEDTHLWKKLDPKGLFYRVVNLIFIQDWWELLEPFLRRNTSVKTQNISYYLVFHYSMTSDLCVKSKMITKNLIFFSIFLPLSLRPTADSVKTSYPHKTLKL